MPAPRRKPLTKAQRLLIKAKTDIRCHVCGDVLESDWWADHVKAHASGGAHAVENYLPACKPCNRMRWDYNPERIKLILEVGVHLCTQMDKGTNLGQAVRRLLERKRKAAVKRRKVTTHVPHEDIVESGVAERMPLIQIDDAAPLTDARRDDLQRRIAEYEANPNIGSTWEEVKARLRAVE